MYSGHAGLNCHGGYGCGGRGYGGIGIIYKQYKEKSIQIIIIWPIVFISCLKLEWDKMLLERRDLVQFTLCTRQSNSY